MEDEIAIKVENVSKDFILPHEKVGSIKNIFTNSLSYIRKKRTFETQHALRDINLEIKKGEFFGIVGRNGSGKSTLLKLLAGIYQPTRGQIYRSGRLVPFIELGVGFNPELTGRQNVYLNGALLGFSEKEIDRMYDEIVAFAELREFMDQKLKNYSSGMQVRLAFSLAIRAEAEILLIDEVLAVGDADFQRKCYEYFKKLKKDKTTVVFVTHDMNAVREYCDRAILIDDSKLLSEGSADAVAGKYTSLFIKNFDSGDSSKKDENRWGDESLKFTHIDVPKKISPNDEDIRIHMKIKANRDVDSPIIGFILKNKQGDNLLGTNTQIEGNRINDLLRDDVISIDWVFPNILSDGKYELTFAAVYDGGVSVADWWETATIITSLRNEPTPYLTKPNTKVRILYEKNTEKPK